jgi:hypothetical protein
LSRGVYAPSDAARVAHLDVHEEFPGGHAAKDLDATTQAELEQELRQAEDDFAHGDFIELTIEQLDRCIAAAEWPWPEESSK